jgi:tRNA threonylcarbamoyl adenosine modification protein YjeE
MRMESLCESEDQTSALAQSLAQRLVAEKTRQKTLCLYGNLGAGKSVFARALIREIMNDPDLEVPSPTFTLVQTYETPFGPLHHFDLYRLEDPEEIFNLGWEEAIGSGIVVVEWPERLGRYKPATTLDIRIQPIENKAHAREILITENKG